MIDELLSRPFQPKRSTKMENNRLTLDLANNVKSLINRLINSIGISGQNASDLIIQNMEQNGFLDSEIADRITRHHVSPDHKIVVAIEKFRIGALSAGDYEFIKNLDSLRVISEDELQLKDGTVIKLGYPNIEADGEGIFEKETDDLRGRKIKAMHFRNRKGGSSEAFFRMMEEEGFHLPGNEGDVSGAAAINELSRIFEMIRQKGSSGYIESVLEILGRTFSGNVKSKDGQDLCEEEVLWTRSPAKDGMIHTLHLHSGSKKITLKTESRDNIYGAFFIKDPISE